MTHAKEYVVELQVSYVCTRRVSAKSRVEAEALACERHMDSVSLVDVSSGHRVRVVNSQCVTGEDEI